MVPSVIHSICTTYILNPKFPERLYLLSFFVSSIKNWPNPFSKFPSEHTSSFARGLPNTPLLGKTKWSLTERQFDREIVTPFSRDTTITRTNPEAKFWNEELVQTWNCQQWNTDHYQCSFSSRPSHIALKKQLKLQCNCAKIQSSGCMHTRRDTDVVTQVALLNLGKLWRLKGTVSTFLVRLGG